MGQQSCCQVFRGERCVLLPQYPSSSEVAQEFFDAAKRGDVDACQQMLGAGMVSDVNWRDPLHGNTALHAATEEGHTAVVRVLLAARANPDAKNHCGLRPLDLAALGTEAFDILDEIEGSLHC
mmetsp:Transcript_104227/g.293936  ORF Transcript_104227/g.293936 Transcript_104227/m.293936 type:complete len:123 (-) Transcript_104227:4-372(-)